ncbi:hypothetical protein ACQ3G7_01025 [Kosakonia oryzendophytica]|uniref:hypothetical protein n=1 Tax=Kosakonia TaxID=1330547 RepID=UPI0021DA98CE|nr:hypothetical protein [Kosakonia sp. ML.JS2a]UXY12342.1 hypothetical protein N7922_07450 [Kosakonia sp. ML.JS2a]
MTIFWCVVPILLLFFGKAWSSSKIREYYSRSQRALQATVAREMDEQQPSWITDVSRRAEFTAGLCELSLKKGVPDWFLESIAGNEEGMHFLTRHAALMESFGAPFRDQIQAAAELVDGAWQRSQSRGY